MSRVISGWRVSWRRYFDHRISLVVGSTTVIFTVVDPTSIPITTFSGALAISILLPVARLTRQSRTGLTRQSRSKLRQDLTYWCERSCAGVREVAYSLMATRV